MSPVLSAREMWKRCWQVPPDDASDPREAPPYQQPCLENLVRKPEVFNWSNSALYITPCHRLPIEKIVIYICLHSQEHKCFRFWFINVRSAEGARDLIFGKLSKRAVERSICRRQALAGHGLPASLQKGRLASVGANGCGGWFCSEFP